MMYFLLYTLYNMTLNRFRVEGFGSARKKDPDPSQKNKMRRRTLEHHISEFYMPFLVQAFCKAVLDINRGSRHVPHHVVS